MLRFRNSRRIVLLSGLRDTHRWRQSQAGNGAKSDSDIRRGGSGHRSVFCHEHCSPRRVLDRERWARRNVLRGDIWPTGIHHGLDDGRFPIKRSLCHRLGDTGQEDGLRQSVPHPLSSGMVLVFLAAVPDTYYALYGVVPFIVGMYMTYRLYVCQDAFSS